MDLRSLVARHHESFNDRDLDALRKVFDEDVEIMVDGAAFRGVVATLGYVTAIFREFPRLRIHDTRVIAEGGDTIVAEHHILNGEPAGGPLRPQGSVCEIYRARDGRIVAYTCYYAPEGADREDVVNVPSRAAGTKMAEEQAALRRVATLVARGVSQDELFAAVNEEVGWLVGADPTSLLRFEADDTVTLVAAWSAADATFPIGSRRPVDDELRSMRDDRRGLRFGPTEPPPGGPFAEEARQLDIRSAVGVPIVVDGRVWGAAFAASSRAEPFREDSMARIAGFAELVATAIANSEARAQLGRLADEQAALRRVATLVARGAAPEEVFAAVTEEVARLFLADLATMARYESDGTYTVVASAEKHFPVGSRWPLEGRNLATVLFEKRRPARIDSYADASGALADDIRAVGVRSAVGAPIIVEDRLWGGTAVATSREQPLPADTEARLASFTELVATAIANAESRAGLAASRARIVAAADETRRRIQRDLHDGTQQQLVSLMLELRSAQAAPPSEGGRLQAQLARTERGLAGALDELREISGGIHPAILTKGGLQPALRLLAGRSAVPVELELRAERRLPGPVEVAAYYVVSEALTNTAKHARASVVHVELDAHDATVQLAIRDDGIGGADPRRGSGLVGLSDRVAALGGTLHVTSPTGDGTTLLIEIPLEGESPEPGTGVG